MISVFPELIPMKKAAGILGVSVQTMRAWIRQRKVASYKTGKNVSISSAEIARILHESERPRLDDVA